MDQGRQRARFLKKHLVKLLATVSTSARNNEGGRGRRKEGERLMRFGSNMESGDWLLYKVWMEEEVEEGGS